MMNSYEWEIKKYPINNSAAKVELFVSEKYIPKDPMAFKAVYHKLSFEIKRSLTCCKKQDNANIDRPAKPIISK